MEKNRPYSQKNAARVSAIQVLYQIQLGKIDPELALQEFHEYHLSNTLEDQDKSIDWKLLRILILGTIEHEESIDAFIINALPENWKFDRLDIMIKNILKIATYELAYHIDTDIPVIISEYLKVTEAFYTIKETKFMNGMLHAISQKARLSIIENA